jgi:DNA-directed RNA polymerase specialized sigma24 family protein
MSTNDADEPDEALLTKACLGDAGATDQLIWRKAPEAVVMAIKRVSQLLDGESKPSEPGKTTLQELQPALLRETTEAARSKFPKSSANAGPPRKLGDFREWLEDIAENVLLLSKAMERCRKALGELVSRNAPRAVRAIKGIEKYCPIIEAEDIIQETCFSAFRDFHHFLDGPAHTTVKVYPRTPHEQRTIPDFEKWLKGIARHRFGDSLRDMRRIKPRYSFKIGADIFAKRAQSLLHQLQVEVRQTEEMADGAIEFTSTSGGEAVRRGEKVGTIQVDFRLKATTSKVSIEQLFRMTCAARIETGRLLLEFDDVNRMTDGNRGHPPGQDEFPEHLKRCLFRLPREARTIEPDTKGGIAGLMNLSDVPPEVEEVIVFPHMIRIIVGATPRTICFEPLEGSPGPRTELERKEALQKISNRLDQLPPLLKHVLTLRVLEEREPKDILGHLRPTRDGHKRSIDNVNLLLFRARKEFEKLFGRGLTTIPPLDRNLIK